MHATQNTTKPNSIVLRRVSAQVVGVPVMTGEEDHEGVVVQKFRTEITKTFGMLDADGSGEVSGANGRSGNAPDIFYVP